MKLDPLKCSHTFGERVILEMVAAETKARGICTYDGIAKRLMGYLGRDALMDEFIKDAFIAMQPDDGDIHIGRNGLTLGKPKTEAA